MYCGSFLSLLLLLFISFISCSADEFDDPGAADVDRLVVRPMHGVVGFPGPTQGQGAGKDNAINYTELFGLETYSTLRRRTEAREHLSLSEEEEMLVREFRDKKRVSGQPSSAAPFIAPNVTSNSHPYPLYKRSDEAREAIRFIESLFPRPVTPTTTKSLPMTMPTPEPLPAPVPLPVPAPALAPAPTHTNSHHVHKPFVYEGVTLCDESNIFNGSWVFEGEESSSFAACAKTEALSVAIDEASYLCKKYRKAEFNRDSGE